MKKTAFTIAFALCLLQLVGCACAPKDDAGTASGDKPNEQAPAEAKDKDDAKAALGKISIDTSLDDEAKARAKTLSATIKKGKFPYKESSKLENADIFLWLAANKTDTTTRAAALLAMSTTFTARTNDKSKKPINDDYRTVVRACLGASDDIVLARAMAAAKLAITGEKPDKKMVASLIEHAENHKRPEGRMLALSTLRSVSNHQEDKRIADATLKALDDDNALLVATGVEVVSVFKMAREDAIKKKLKGLLDHKDAHVRGRAVIKYATIVKRTKKTGKAVDRIVKLLKDKSPFVRSEAADALARLNAKPTVHKMVKLLGDTKRNSISTPYTTLGGDRLNMISDGSGWSRVDDAVLHALRDITRDMGKDKFELRDVRFKHVDEDIKAAAKDAKAWYKAHKDDLPKS